MTQVSFTGSTEVGALVGAAAAKNIKPCTLELGGKSAAIVWKDVDIDAVCVCVASAELHLRPLAQDVLVDFLCGLMMCNACALQVVREAHNALFFNHGQCCAAGALFPIPGINTLSAMLSGSARSTALLSGGSISACNYATPPSQPSL